MPSSQSSPKRSRALLPSLPLTFSTPLIYSPGLLRHRRHLHLRGPVLLLSKTATLPDPSVADKLLVLSSTHPPRPSGPASVLVHPMHKLIFPSRLLRDHFLRAASNALNRSAGRPNSYEFLRRIGSGATGVAYMVRRKEDGKLLAAKAVPKTEAFLSTSALDNLVAERTALAEAAQRQSPFLVRLEDVFETRRHLCFVTELASYGDLRALQRRFPDERVPEAAAKRLFAELVLALEETHRMGFLYRDMKPANVLVTGTGHVRLADFGLAKRLRVEFEGSSVSSESGGDGEEGEEGESEELFRLVGRTRSFVGTKRFMSPEHLRGGYARHQGYGAAADVWALGVTLYVLLTGKYPYGRRVAMSNSAAMFYAVQSEEIGWPEEVSEEARGVLQGMLERDALERFNLAEIKGHAWMKGVDWAKVRREAREDVEVKEVVEWIRGGGVKKMEEQGSGEGKSEAGEADSMFSSVTGGKGGKRRKGGLEEYELLGFGYRNFGEGSV